MENRILADAYRPGTFGEMFRQHSVVTLLSGRIKRGGIDWGFLLHGAVGSGKTTLARMFARALNCRAPEPDGSPCFRCDACGSRGDRAITGFHEYNVSRYGGGREAVGRWVEELNRPETEHRHRTLFFDEAHALSGQAQDLLLNHVEEPAEGVVFGFATTEVERLKPALRSRVMNLLIRPLSTVDAVTFLRRVAAREGITCEPGALELLAGLRPGYPRDLLLGLDRVWERDAALLSVAQVRDAFDAHQTEVLVAYFGALADGDFDRQTDLAFDWREEAADKGRWIQAFLVSLYHNDILGRRLVVDGVIASIPARERASIVDRFRRRLGLTTRAQLEAYWHWLMAFWSDPEPAADETALRLRLTLFHRMVNGDATDAGAAEGGGGSMNPPVPPPTFVSMAGAASSWGRGLPAPAHPGPPVTASAPGFLEAADVRRIVDAASFLMQEHGVVFDAAFEVTPALLGVPGPASAAATVVAFREELATQARAWGGEMRASLTLVEREPLGVVGRIVAHLRTPNPLDPADADGVGRTAAWARAWRGGAIRGGGDAVTFDAAPPPGEPAALAFHWDRVLALCAGLDRRIEAWDPATATPRPLLTLLGVRPRDTRAYLGRPLIELSALLSDEAVAAVRRDRLPPLSAFGDGAWRSVRTGWELDEFHVRQARRAARAHELAGLRQRHGDDTPAARAAIAAAVHAWASDPRAWPRRWRGWWA